MYIINNNIMKSFKAPLSLTLTIMSAGNLSAQELQSKTEDVKRSALILIECQNEWMHPEGVLYNKLIEDYEMFNQAVKNIESALAYARKVNMPVIHCGLRFQKGHPELANGKTGLREAIARLGTFPEHGFRSEFHESVRPVSGEFIVTGRTGSSGFAGSNLDIFLRQNNIETVYLVGFATHVCVESTFREAHDKGYYPVMISDACSAFNRDQQEYVIEHIIHHYGEEITTENFHKLYR